MTQPDESRGSEPAPAAIAAGAAVMDRVGVWWGIAGGWAIDLWLGEQTREHHDVEVVVRRCDQGVIHAALSADWELFALDPPGSGWKPWNGTPIDAGAFQLQARSSVGEFDLFTETVDDDQWYFRCDGRITTPADGVVMLSAVGIPIVRPELQLLYMARSTEPKNERDFQATRPHLTADAAAWLADALRITLPGHHWLRQLG